MTQAESRGGTSPRMVDSSLSPKTCPSVWDSGIEGRALNSLEPDIHKIGSIEKEMRRGVSNPLLILRPTHSDRFFRTVFRVTVKGMLKSKYSQVAPCAWPRIRSCRGCSTSTTSDGS